MCGIVGVSFKRDVTYRARSLENLRHLFTAMLLEAQERGSAATGIVLVARDDSRTKPNAYILRAPLCAKDFVKTDEYKKLLERINVSTLSIIGHTRAVSGELKSAEDNTNNHPHFYGDVVGVHNGRVLNDDKLWDRYSSYISRRSTCDSEIIFALMDRKLKGGSSVTTESAFASAIAELRGWHAIAAINLAEPGKVVLMRDAESPLELGWLGEPEVAVFASRWTYIEKNIHKDMRRSTKQYDLKPYKIVTLDSDAPSNWGTLFLGQKEAPEVQSVAARSKMIAEHKEDYDLTQGRAKKA